jgi:hypothetical protein
MFADVFRHIGEYIRKMERFEAGAVLRSDIRRRIERRRAGSAVTGTARHAHQVDRAPPGEGNISVPFTCVKGCCAGGPSRVRSRNIRRNADFTVWKSA